MMMMGGGQTGAPPGEDGEVPLSQVQWGVIFSFGWKLLSVCKGLAIAYIAANLLQMLVNLGMAQLLGQITRQLGGGGSGAGSGSLVGLYFIWAACALGALGVGIPLRWISTKMDATISNHLRAKLFDRILRQTPEFFHAHDPGELNAIVNQFTVESAMTMRQIAVDLLMQIAVLIVTLGVVIHNFQMDGPPPTIGGVVIPPWLIPVSIVLFAFVSPWITGKMADRLRTASTELQERMLALSSLVTGATQSPEEIQSMQAEGMFGKKHQGELDALLKSRVKNSLTVEGLNLVNGLPSWFIQAVMLGFGVYLAVRSGDASSAGNVVAIFLLTPQLMSPISALSAYIVMAGSAWPRIETVTEMLESRSRSEEAAGSFTAEKVPPTLEAKSLIFSYRATTRRIFEGLEFTVPPGKITGFVAKTGQGKTTFFKLALRFYDPQEGQIILGGRDVRDYTLSNLRNHISMMSQFPAFFYDTLRENMRIAKPEASDAEIKALCERTGVWEILERSLGEEPLDADFSGGRKLSGGQKKLLALTRCLLRDPAILFLDEPTVGMDNEEKFELLDRIREAAKGRTVMVVDHDLNWLMPFCDHFIVLDEGRVVEQGSGPELLAKGGLLRELYTVSQDAQPHANPPAPAAS